MREMSKKEIEAREEIWEAIGYIGGALKCLHYANADRDAIYSEINAKAFSIQLAIGALEKEEEDNG